MKDKQSLVLGNKVELNRINSEIKAIQQLRYKFMELSSECGKSTAGINFNKISNAIRRLAKLKHEMEVSLVEEERKD